MTEVLQDAHGQKCKDTKMESDSQKAYLHFWAKGFPILFVTDHAHASQFHNEGVSKGFHVFLLRIPALVLKPGLLVVNPCTL